MYFDRGQGWLEEDSITIPLSLYGNVPKKITVSLFDTAEIKNIRIDPVDCESGICVESIRLLDQNGKEVKQLSYQDVCSNAAYRKENDYLFLTDDPNFYIYQIPLESAVQLDISFLILDKEEMAVKLLKSFYLEKPVMKRQ